MIGQAFAWVLIAWGVVQFFQGNWMSGIWSGFIGFFLNNAAQSGYQQVLIKRALRGESVRRFMNADPIVVSPTLNLLHWVEDYVYRYHHRAFPVVENGRIEGIVSTEALNQIPRSEWAEHSVAEIQFSELRAVSILPEADALQALATMQQSGSNLLLVTDGDRLVGIISLKDIIRFLHMKLELEGGDDADQVPRDSKTKPPREGPMVQY
jgi:CBS domain-containing protein